MAGDTFLASVDEGLDTVIASARTTREFASDVMMKVCDKQTLAPGTGTTWYEWLAAAINAYNYGETDIIDDPQELDGSKISATPQLTACQTFIGKRVATRLNPKAYATFGRLAQEAMNRKADEDGLALFATATTTLCGSGTTLSIGHITAGVRRITSNATEPGSLPIAVVLHGYGIQDIQNELMGGIGTYPIPTGYTAEVFKSGFRGMITDANVYEDGNITINGTPDAAGAVFSKMAVVHVQGMSPWTERREEPQKGYGGVSVWLKNEYIWVERSPGNWMYRLLHDATAPTS